MQVRESITVSPLDRSKSKNTTALFDTGAKFTFINTSLGKELGFTRYREPKRVQLAVRGKEGKIVGETSLIFTVAGCEIPLPIQTYVVEDLMEDAIIGTNFMEGFDVSLDLKEGRAEFRRYPPEVRLI